MNYTVKDNKTDVITIKLHTSSFSVLTRKDIL